VELQWPGQRSRLEHPAVDLPAWTEALRALPAAPVTERDIVAWIDGALRRFFFFENFMGGYGRWSGGRVHVLSMLSSGHSSEYMASRPGLFELNERPSVAWWIQHQRPFFLDEKGAVDEGGAPVPTSKLDLDGIRRFSLRTGVVHGVVDPYAKCGTYISFTGVSTARLHETFAALKLIAPVLHMLFLQTKTTEFPPIDRAELTDRQLELIDLALAGLSDKEIAARLAISDHTVGNHFRAIYAKLGVTKRSQLIALLK
jgi:DNA-binding CsgD family transcriptional regulator